MMFVALHLRSDLACPASSPGMRSILEFLDLVCYLQNEKVSKINNIKGHGRQNKKKIVLYENVFFFTHMIHINKLFGINRNMTDATDRQKLL